MRDIVCLKSSEAYIFFSVSPREFRTSAQKLATTASFQILVWTTFPFYSEL
jgi:hypothetical protein